jgi:hypothetical protein
MRSSIVVIHRRNPNVFDTITHGSLLALSAVRRKSQRGRENKMYCWSVLPDRNRKAPVASSQHAAQSDQRLSSYPGQ